MIEEKRAIIEEEGLPVTVYDPHNDIEFQTTALLGKATRQFFSEISLESHRQAQFLPELPIKNGLTVVNNITNEKYLIVASYNEIIDSMKCSTVVRMILCNTVMSVFTMTEDADERGNIKKVPMIKYSDVNVYAEALGGDLKEKSPGIQYESKFKVYSPNIKIDYTDSIALMLDGENVLFKLTGKDTLTFKGVAMIDIVSETRR